MKPHLFLFGEEALSALDHTFESVFGPANCYILCDINTEEYCLPLVMECTFFKQAIVLPSLPAGEISKNPSACLAILEVLQDKGASRDDVLLCLGGGVICDIGGFVAAVYKRGMQLLSLPTSLMAMTDAAHGGKNGIDFKDTKNILGTFYTPQGIVVHTPFLDTLPESEFIAGMAEMFKHGLIASPDLWRALRDANNIYQAVRTCLNDSIQIKYRFVEADPLDRAERQALNYGHTAGHAIESYFLRHAPTPISHGQAIAAGMCIEAELSVIYHRLPEEQKDEICETMGRFFPGLKLPPEAFSELMGFMKHDKKGFWGIQRFTLLREIGNPVTGVACAEDAIHAAFSRYFEWNLG